MNVIDWFNGKSVATVGNAQFLFDKDYGKLIDSHDVVVRLNKGAMIPNLPKISHGVKMDIVIASRWNLVKYFHKKYIIKKSMFTDIKFIMCGRHGRDDLKQPIEQKIWYYPLPRHKELKWQLLNLEKKQDPSTGIIALDIISHGNPKSVSIFGFDWKETPTFYDLNRQHEPHVYDVEKEYCLNYFVDNLGYTYYK